MNMRRAIGRITAPGVVGAKVKGITARRRALAAVAPALHHPMLYLPLNINNAMTLALTRRMPASSGPSRPGIRVTEQTVPAEHDSPAVSMQVYERSCSAGGVADQSWENHGVRCRVTLLSGSGRPGATRRP
jgi:hypothetical protein